VDEILTGVVLFALFPVVAFLLVFLFLVIKVCVQSNSRHENRVPSNKSSGERSTLDLPNRTTGYSSVLRGGTETPNTGSAECKTSDQSRP
jgi:hypothetical protein